MSAGFLLLATRRPVTAARISIEQFSPLFPDAADGTGTDKAFAVEVERDQDCPVLESRGWRGNELACDVRHSRTFHHMGESSAG